MTDEKVGQTQEQRQQTPSTTMASFLPGWPLESCTSTTPLSPSCTRVPHSVLFMHKAHTTRYLNVCLCPCVCVCLQSGPAWPGLAPLKLCRAADRTRRGQRLRERRGCSNLLISLIPWLWVPCQQDAGNKGRGKQLMTLAAVHCTMPTHTQRSYVTKHSS